MRVQLRKTLPGTGELGMELLVWRIRSLDSAVQIEHEEVTGRGKHSTVLMEENRYLKT